MGRPVEIEFAMEIKNKEYAQFYLLQIRPIVDNKSTLRGDLSEINKDEAVLFSKSALGHGIYEDIHDIVYVKTKSFNAANNTSIANEIEIINRSFSERDRTYMLIGPGRWGSSDPWLGIPVKWAYISQAQIMVELGLENYRVEPSQGTHFFQNLTSFGVGYITLAPYLNKEEILDMDYLDSQSAVYETQFIRHIHLERPLIVKIDGRKGYGIVEKPR
jgi:hypothetical protein